MKLLGIIGIVIASIMIVSGCSVDWKDEKDRKIAELESKLLVLEEKLDAKSKESESNSLSNKGLCFSKGEEYKKKSNNRNAITSIFYSPILDTCVAEMNFDGEIPPSSRDGNYFSKGIVNILTGESLGHLSYFDLFGFEDPGFLPKECQRQFQSGVDSKELNLIISTNDNNLANKIYSSEFQYENCLAHIKGTGTVKVNATRTPSVPYVPVFIEPPINY